MSPARRLDSVCDIVMGQAPDGAGYNTDGEGWPLVAGAGDFGEMYPEPKKFSRAAGKLSQPGDIILGIRATIGEKVLSDREYCLGRGVAGLRPRGGLNAGYLWHWLGSVRSELAAKGKGATFKQVNREDIGALKITLPELSEQRRIAEVLDRAEVLRAKRREAIGQLEALEHAIFLELFGDPMPSGWRLTTVEEIADQRSGSIRTGPFGSQLLHSEFVEDGIAVLGIDNVVSNKFQWGERRFITEAKYLKLKRYTVNPGDVLITIMGTCGRCAIVPEHMPVAINTKHLCCITLDQQKCLPAYLHAYFLRHPLARQYLEQAAKGAIMSGLNMSIIKALPILLPPIELQREYVRRLTGLGNLKETFRASLTAFDSLFASLQHRAFQGTLWDEPVQLPAVRMA